MEIVAIAIEAVSRSSEALKTESLTAERIKTEWLKQHETLTL